jgi:hypothetical protein
VLGIVWSMWWSRLEWTDVLLVFDMQVLEPMVLAVPVSREVLLSMLALAHESLVGESVPLMIEMVTVTSHDEASALVNVSQSTPSRITRSLCYQTLA